MKNKFAIFFLLLGLVFFAGKVLAVTCPSSGSWDSSSGVCIPNNTGLPSPGGDSPLATVINNVMKWLLLIVGSIAIIAFVISGIQYLTSAGDQNAIENAKRNMWWSIVGVVVALIGMIILNFVFTTILGGSSS
ncbi:MAG: pilin [Parcubacteria group bacterium]|jgi:heme/copper-type cytochrome/quinol oxidase subunit 2